MHVEAGIVAALLVGRGKVRAHGDCDNLRILPPDLRNKIVTVLVRQTDIAEDHVHLILLKKLETARGGIAGGNVVVPAPKNRRAGALGVLMVLDQKDGTHMAKGGKDQPLHLLFGSRSFAGRVFPRVRYRDFTYSQQTSVCTRST